MDDDDDDQLAVDDHFTHTSTFIADYYALHTSLPPPLPPPAPPAPPGRGAGQLLLPITTPVSGDHDIGIIIDHRPAAAAPYDAAAADMQIGSGGGGSRVFPKQQQQPQWTHAETVALLAARADLNLRFISTKRNKPLWDTVAARLLSDHGFARTPHQCKSKWKNLLTRYKGSVAGGQFQFPYMEEMTRIIGEARSSPQQTPESSKAAAGAGKEPPLPQLEPAGDHDGTDDDEQAADYNDEDDDYELAKEMITGGGGSSGRTIKRGRQRVGHGDAVDQNGIKVALRALLQQQEEWDAQQTAAVEMRETERRAKEAEWRQAMAAMSEERLAMVRRWREREEERQARAEVREERRHQLLIAILNKLNSSPS